ncbi:ubiquinol-cytochrome C chaperone family protein [Sphingomicrobium lutaoense]|uniref:Cytochrome b pre-mRNA-processing protein 3 n=1 Tax=Sphingomicrobium lutaoense TaxID=515949 RepID=A0A839Z434_9SPHN|nr:ubiquinol-cytochrome C chaperone family protein [Sphingomicrobium lutaoense]MBB3764847.1 cytochrome b pre-mRNA-processing protein 3 [Sphingomicrobium lutaoense]
MRRILSLFRSSSGADAGAPYAALVAEARRPEWYRDGRVEDDMDGRFAVLSSLVALTILRLERGSEEAVRGSVSLTEQFIADMDAQMREIGFDTTIGKQVRGLVGALASRVDIWRRAQDGEEEWQAASDFSIFRDKPPCEESATFAAERLRRFSEQLDGADDDEVMQGKW